MKGVYGKPFICMDPYVNIEELKSITKDKLWYR